MARLPSRVGPYDVISPLGAGGMAETYVAVRKGPAGFEQRVCLKRVRRDLAQDPDFVRQFLAEATIAATLRHPNVAQVLDFGSQGEAYYLALELVDGLDLRALLDANDSRLPPRFVVYVARELCAALEYAHRGGGPEARPGIVHRDVSPSNVLVGVEGEVKLTDFGIARSPRGPKHTVSGVVKGKIPYLAPEYARTGRFDERCDFFSLGVMLYECLAGRRPHEGETELALLERAANGAHEPLVTLAPDAPEALATLVERLIDPDPDRRPRRAAEVLDVLLTLPADAAARRDLGALVAAVVARRAAVASGGDEVGALEPPSPTEPLTERTRGAGAGQRRRPGPWLALGAAGAVGLAVTAAATLHEPTPAPPETATAARSVPIPAPAPAPVPVTVGSLAVAPPAQADTSTSAPVAPAPAVLRVVVVPFGEVTVDGVPRGQAPVEVSLSPGLHGVRATAAGRALEPRTITLEAGERRILTLR